MRPAPDALAEYDITGKIGQRFRTDLYRNEPEWPMYSYDRASSILWNNIGRELTRAGWTEEQVKTYLGSKLTRWALDGTLGDWIAILAVEWAKRVTEGKD